MDKEFTDRVDAAANLLSAGWSSTAEMSLRGAIEECAKHYPTAGASAYQRWISSLESLGEVCISIAKRERRNKSL